MNSRDEDEELRRIIELVENDAASVLRPYGSGTKTYKQRSEQTLKPNVNFLQRLLKNNKSHNKGSIEKAKEIATKRLGAIENGVKYDDNISLNKKNVNQEIEVSKLTSIDDIPISQTSWKKPSFEIQPNDLNNQRIDKNIDKECVGSRSYSEDRLESLRSRRHKSDRHHSKSRESEKYNHSEKLSSKRHNHSEKLSSKRHSQNPEVETHRSHRHSNRSPRSENSSMARRSRSPRGTHRSRSPESEPSKIRSSSARSHRHHSYRHRSKGL